LQCAGGLVAGEQRRQFAAKVGINCIQGSLRPFAFTNVKQSSAAGVTVFHDLFAGQPKVQVVVGKKDGGEFFEIFGLVIFEPEDLGGSEAGRDSVAESLDGFFEAAKFFGDFFAFGSSGSVAPQFGGTNDFAVAIERNKTVLLAADPDRFDFGGDGFGLAERATDATGNSVAPGVRMLLFCARREIGDEIVFLSSGGEDFAVARVDDEDFGGLSAAVDAEQEISHIYLVPFESENRNRNSRERKEAKSFCGKIIGKRND